MKQSFPGYYLPSKEEFAALWKECIFVLDANVLLNIYRYPQQARDDFISVLSKISDRIWIPFHTALEYQRNRIGVIIEQNKRFHEVKKILEETQKTLLSRLDQLQLKKRHSSIDPERFITDVRSIFDSFIVELDKQEGLQLSIQGDDPIRNKIEEILVDKMGSPPNNQEHLDAIFKNGEARYEVQQPPGYLDSKKEKDNVCDKYSYGDLVYHRKFGDLIIWKQIIEEAKSRKIKHLIFITDDDKEDWWLIVNYMGEKQIGPRPELIEEICREAGTEHFYMYNSERFMKYASEYLGVQINKKSIGQVKDLAVLARESYVGAATTVNYEKLYISSDLHRYSLNLSVTLQQPPDQEHFQVVILWPTAVRITLLENIEIGKELFVDSFRYKKLSIVVDRRIFPGQTLKIIGSNALARLEYEYDHRIWGTMDEKPRSLFYELYLPNWQPVKGEVPFSQLNIF